MRRFPAFGENGAAPSVQLQRDERGRGGHYVPPAARRAAAALCRPCEWLHRHVAPQTARDLWPFRWAAAGAEGALGAGAQHAGGAAQRTRAGGLPPLFLLRRPHHPRVGPRRPRPRQGVRADDPRARRHGDRAGVLRRRADLVVDRLHDPRVESRRRPPAPPLPVVLAPPHPHRHIVLGELPRPPDGRGQRSLRGRRARRALGVQDQGGGVARLELCAREVAPPRARSLARNHALAPRAPGAPPVCRRSHRRGLLSPARTPRRSTRLSRPRTTARCACTTR